MKGLEYGTGNELKENAAAGGRPMQKMGDLGSEKGGRAAGVYRMVKVEKESTICFSFPSVFFHLRSLQPVSIV